MMLKSLHTWRVAWNSLLVSIFFFFLSFWNFVLFLYFRGSLVYFMCIRVAPLCAFNAFTLLIKNVIMIFLFFFPPI
jgi:hypothetical protein